MQALESILQLHVATDQAAIAHLPFILSALTYDILQPSSHLPKWIARINSLLTSKNAGSRWAGLCMALQTSILNNEIMKESSPNWISICLPILSRNEDNPNLKASMRLLDYIFFQARSISEFQRQLATPNVPKYSAALLALAEKTENSELQILCLDSLRRLVPVYPALHRQLQSNISSFCFRLLSGKTTGTDPNIVNSTCALLSVVHLTGGKVISTTAWQKTLETSIVNAWSAFSSLRFTFTSTEVSKLTQNVSPTFKPPPSDPMIAVPLSIDRLKSASRLIIHLLKAPVYRPTAVAIGELVKLVLALMNSTSQEKVASFDVQRRGLEAAIAPQIWEVACELLSQMAISFRHHLNDSLCRILSCIIRNTQQASDNSHKLIFLRPLKTVLSHTYSLHSVVLLDRLVKHLLSRLAVILPQKIINKSQTQEVVSKKGRKRARGFDGDDVFQASAAVLCASHVDEGLLVFSLDALELLLPNPHLTVSLRTLSARLLLSVLSELSRTPANSLSHNLGFHGTLYSKILTLCRKQLTYGTSRWLPSGIELTISAIDRSNVAQGDDNVFQLLNESRRDVDMLLHPRLPPVLRSNLPVELDRETFGIEGGQETEIMPTVSPVIQPEPKDQHPPIERGSVNLPTIQAQEGQREVDLLMSSEKAAASPMSKTVENPLTSARTTLMDTGENVASFLLKKRMADSLFNDRPENSLVTSKLTVEKSGAFASPPVIENELREFVPPRQSAKPSESDIDVDDEGIPEINLESDSD